MSWSKDEVLAFLNDEVRVGRLATVDADGAPHVVPVWFEVDGDRLLVHSGGASRKVRNIRESGRFSLAVDKDVMPYKGVSIDGAARIGDDGEFDWAGLARRLSHRYLPAEAADGFAEYIIGMPGEHAVLVLSVDAWTAWDYSQG